MLESDAYLIESEWESWRDACLPTCEVEPLLIDLLRGAFYAGSAASLQLQSGGTSIPTLLAELRARNQPEPLN